MPDDQPQSIEIHPVQNHEGKHKPGRITSSVTLRAYEVYRKLYGDQKALITEGCRGGFSSGELIAFLYARSFPELEWRRRVDEAIAGMQGL